MQRAARSFRHRSISRRLIAEAGGFLQARNTGTSSAMLERLYGRVKPRRMAEELRPEWRMGA